MTIDIATTNIETSDPVVVHLRDRSGCMTILTCNVADLPPIHHTFDYQQGDLREVLNLRPGVYWCLFTLQVHHYKREDLNTMYDAQVFVNGALAASARGHIDENASDSGVGQFSITVLA
jgi:hypothetical protein